MSETTRRTMLFRAGVTAPLMTLCIRRRTGSSADNQQVGDRFSTCSPSDG